ncbi:MAG: TolC family protein, partial [Isosphaeraceae bacterium]
MARNRAGRVVVGLLPLVASGCIHLPTRPLFVSFPDPPPLVERARFDDAATTLGPPEVKPIKPATENPAAEPDAGLPVDYFIRLGLDQNRTVQAARFNLLALQQRLPQVTSLDDPVVSNSIFPIPSVAPQYSLMGYMPYGALLAQQFPWFGTLRLRGEAASADAAVALQELAAAQLDTVAAVKRTCFDLGLGQRTLAILAENRRLAEEFAGIAREKLRTGSASQTDVLRAEATIADIDRETELAREGLAEARAELGRQIHAPLEGDVRVAAAQELASLPTALDRLRSLAVASRPELRGRLAAIARDERGILLAEKRYYPNVTLGLIYQDMEKTNAMMPQTAGGMPNVGLFVGFNLPVYRKKLAAGVCEAKARAAADAMLYESERDEVLRDVETLFARARSRSRGLELLRDSNLVRSRAILESATSDYRAGNIDYLNLLAAWRDLLQVELQVAQAEAELGKTLAALERAVGCQINEQPPVAESAPAAA